MAPIRVLVVEDSLTVRKHLVEVLTGDPAFEVVAEAADGQSAIDLCRKLRPDVITLDIVLPGLDGVAVTEQIMAYCPTPILIVSASFNRGEVFQTYDALAAGAVDVLDKPGTEDPSGMWARAFLHAIRLVSRIRVVTHPRAKLKASQAPAPDGLVQVPPVVARPARPDPGRRSEDIRLVAIGASTGGPSAVVKILRGLPPDFPLPILLVVHIGDPFGAPFAEWLDRQSALSVSLAAGGDSLLEKVGGRVILAPPDRHLIVQDGRLRLSDAPPRHSCRPSVDVLFESVAREIGREAVACLLTGMGRDGAAGMLAVRQAGGRTLAQDEETCVVFGMPREAILLDAATGVLPIGQFAPALADLAGARRSLA